MKHGEGDILGEGKQQFDTVTGISASITAEVEADYDVQFHSDDAVFTRERMRQDAFLETKLPPVVRSATRAYRDAEQIPEILGETKVSSHEHIFSRFPIKTQDVQRSGKAWKLYYRYEKSLGQLVLNSDSVIQEELASDSATEVRDVLWWSEKCEQINAALLRRDIDINLQELVQQWETRKGFVAAMRKDLPFFIAMYRNVSSGETGMEDEFEKFLDTYYVRASLKRRRKEGDEKVTYTKADPVNWKVACAIAIASGTDAEVAFVQYGTKEDAREGVLAMAQKLKTERASENDLSPLYNENARIVGRIVMSQYIHSRMTRLEASFPNKRERVQRVLEEVILLMTLCISPGDTRAAVLQRFADPEDLCAVVRETYGEKK